MARGKLGSLSTTGPHQGAGDIEATKAERLESFLNTINEELDQMEQLILNTDQETLKATTIKDENIPV